MKEIIENIKKIENELGNRKKLLTILVDPILNYDLKITGFNRLVEKILNKKNGIIKGQYYEKK